VASDKGEIEVAATVGQPEGGSFVTLTSRDADGASVVPLELDDTFDTAGSITAGAEAAGITVERRTTVLPRRRAAVGAAPSAAARPRFDRVRKLGEGGMGEVELVRDNDIRRTVALKRLRGDTSSEAALARFADEVRIVGQLEHPSIVPIYDVGRDEEGRVYLVMKHLQGETMEEVIAHLREGSPEYVAKYTVAHRIHLFMQVVDALRYAHARGIVHRDIKPANVMIGPYGEVTVLDWGIAKVLSSARARHVEPLDRTAVESNDVPLETRIGSLAGTPLYMSPEQAAGRNDEIDGASDTYTLCLVLYEWLSLAHPLRDERNVSELLARIIARDYTGNELAGPAFEVGVPLEYLRVCMHGLRRKRSERFASVAELERELEAVQAGHMRVQCHVTLAKRGLHGIIHWIDRHPMGFTLLGLAAILAVLAGVVFAVVAAVRAA
jgi:serine/threonine-protein kinase